MVDQEKSMLWNSAKKGFVIFGLLSLLVNIANLIISFYSPAFSIFYLAFSYLPIRVLGIFHHFNDNELFAVVSIVSILTDGIFGAIFSVIVAKITKVSKTSILIIIYPIYWVIAAFAFRINF